jgi:peptidoglycan/xylan/chitin deacetylase (PgdA/CDA1 family)
MGGKRELLSNGLGRLGLASLVPRGWSGGLSILAYHRVLDIGDEDRFPCDPELVSAGVEEFRAQMAYLRRDWAPISLAAAVDAMQAGRPLPPRSVAVTFDDGHVDNHTHAFPILRQFDIPATIFLSTGYIDSPRQFWFDRICTLLFFAPAGANPVPGLAQPVALSDVASRRAAAGQVLEAIKRLPHAVMLAAVDELEARLGSHVPARPLPSGALAWEQVREMSRHGIDFGSHTVSHALLAMTQGDELRDELAASREAIQHHVGRPCDLLAYPVGKPYAFNDEVVAVARDCGYRAALSYVDGVDQPGRANLFALKRVSVERYYSPAMFQWRLLLPRWFL